MVYHYASSVSLCRPSAFYQEPGYFAATAAPVLLLMSFELQFGKVPEYLRSVLRFAWLFLFAALVLCLSRLGWLLAAVLIAFEGYWFLRGRYRKRKGIKKEKSTQAARRRLPVWTFALPLILLIVMAAQFGPLVYTYLGKPTYSQDGSVFARANSIRQGLDVFMEHPLAGVGPGNSGGYFVQNFHVDPREAAQLRRAPLALSVYPELLAEWGFLGTVFFCLGFWFLLFGSAGSKFLKNTEALQVLFVFMIVYASTQTLPRFDLWMILGLTLSFLKANGTYR